MAIYHCSVKIGSRSKGQSAVAASAYRSGTKMTERETGLVSDYTRKGGVVYSEIALCSNAPREYLDREVLWNAVHNIEKSKDARLWREIEVALPKELNTEQQIATVQDFVKGLTEQGMCADWSLHDKNDGNPHAHIMLTTRPIEPNGEWTKLKEKKEYALDDNGERIPLIDQATGQQKVDSRNRKQWKRITVQDNTWNSKEYVEQWRASWAECCNARLAERDRIDHRSYARQGIEQIPTIHEGYAARQMAAKGKISERISINEEIRQRNSLIQTITEQLKAIGEQIKQLTEQIKEKGSVMNERLAKLLERRKQAINGEIGAADGSVGGIADGKRTAAYSTEETGNSDKSAGGNDRESTAADTETIIRQSETLLRESEIRVQSSAAGRADREAERERLRAEESRRNAERLAREREEMAERAERRSMGGHSR